MTALALAEGEGSIIDLNGSLIVVFVLFLIFVFLMTRLLFRPIGQVLAERESLTVGAVTEARASNRQYRSRLDEYESAIRQARGESYRFLEQRRAATLEERRRMIEEARDEATRRIGDAKSEIAAESEIARAQLEAESRRIADQISRTILGRPTGGAAD